MDPFGQLVPNRHGNSSSYRYGFNGKELDNELKGEGNSYDFGSRVHDPRIGRFLSLDPKMSEYSSMSPYCYAANNPIKFIDINGEGPGDEIPLNIPSSPEKIDTKIWTPIKPNEGIERGHTQRWFNKETGTTLAFDQGKDGAPRWEGKDHFHVYNKEGQRLQASGEVAGGVKDGKSFYNKSAANSHFTPDETTQIKIKVPSAKTIIRGTVKAVKIVNRVLVPVAVVASVYDVATSDNKPKAIASQAGGWTGAWLGGKAGASVGATAGAAVGVWFFGAGAAPGAAIGGVIGGFVGSIGGYMAGSSAGEAAYDATNK
ncbi:RHS repeat-associated core domain-containing protein [Flavobacterium sp.]|uniref:RHS repeat-associated core domain-containing protein n=1 Tax=Flavobacterium sp. TaxID=239 RepID=UPI00374CE558